MHVLHIYSYVYYCMHIATYANKLLFNESKSAHLHLGKEFGSHTYTLNESNIITVNNTKDLGILFTNNVNFSHHYEKITAGAYKTLGLLRRTFSTHCVYARKQLYLMLVRSQLLYCSQLWRPILLKDIVTLERVQRRASKFILNDYTSSYKSRLIQLSLLPLMYQYELNDLLFFIKSYNSPSECFDIRRFVHFRSSSTRSSSASKLVHQISANNNERHFYFCRISRLWAQNEVLYNGK